MTGEAGDVVTAEVGVRNDGPATLDSGRSGESIAWIKVGVPAGATVVSVPEGCDEDGSIYNCFSGTLLPVSESQTFEFGLRIDRVVADAGGRVVVNEPCECSQFAKDLDMSNNTSAIVLNGTGAGGPDAGDGAGGGEGGGLPVTGPVGTAVAGAGLLVAGGAGVLMVRRRRTRFVA